MEKLIRKKFNDYKGRCKSKKLDFHLTYLQFKFIVKKDCYYCGLKAENKPNGIDRVNNNRGYYHGNIVPCCWDCNRSKSNLTPADFDDYLARIKNDEPNYIKIRRNEPRPSVLEIFEMAVESGLVTKGD